MADRARRQPLEGRAAEPQAQGELGQLSEMTR
jgi:hypothetical protein